MYVKITDKNEMDYDFVYHDGFWVHNRIVNPKYI